MFVLDSNVVSELMRASPNGNVVRWIARCPSSALFTTTITVAEILYGVALLPRGRRRSAIAKAAREMFADDLRGRVLPFDIPAAEQFAAIASARRAGGQPIAHADAQIAAITASRGATLATRNTEDFEGTGISFDNPWGE